MWQVIFQVYVNGKWLDYCREQSPQKDFNMTQKWAMDWCIQLEHREHSPFRPKFEYWN